MRYWHTSRAPCSHGDLIIDLDHPCMKMSISVRTLRIAASIQPWQFQKAGVTSAVCGFTLRGISQQQPDGRYTESKALGGCRGRGGVVHGMSMPCLGDWLSQHLCVFSCLDGPWFFLSRTFKWYHVGVFGGQFFRAGSFSQKGAL